MRKIALCFLTYKNITRNKLWNFLLKNCKNKYNIYIHNKYKFKDKITNFDKRCLKKKVRTSWGTISLVKATLLLFEEAFKDKDNKFFILLSDKCIPIYNLDYIYNKVFEINNNIIKCYVGNKSRYNNMKDKSFLKRENFMKQNQWMLLNRETVLFFIKNNFINNFGYNFHIPDEHYFISIIIKFNIKYKNEFITYVNWTDKSDSKKYRMYPKTYCILNYKNVIKIRESSNFFFMRKISEDCVFDKKFLDIYK
jgi:hypothetical protein